MHKQALLLLLLLLPLGLHSQTTSINGTITDTQYGLFPSVNVSLIKNGNLLQVVQTDFDGKYIISNIETGTYDLKLSYAGMRDELIPIQLTGNSNSYDFYYPKPCVPAKKVCPQGHTNTIIPIVYGFPSEKTMKKAQKGKLKLGGCDPTPCAKWHCAIHNIDF